MSYALSTSSVLGQESPYGSSKFSSYADIDSVKQLKAVWDFNFVDPKAVRVAFNNIGALLQSDCKFRAARHRPYQQ